MQPLKPFIQFADSGGNSHIMEFVTQHQRVGMDKVVVLDGALVLKDGTVVTIKIVRALKWPFLGRHVRITGNCTTTQDEIAQQLNELYAEE